MSSADLFKTLESAREVQRSYIEVRDKKTGKKTRVAAPNATAPDLCLAASKFVAGKLAGLFKESSHLNDLVLNRAQAPGKERIAPAMMKSAWGTLSGHDSFNQQVLPASLKRGAGAANTAWTLVEPPQFWCGISNRHVDLADTLLQQGVPLVVGVSLHGTGTRDHFVCVVRHQVEESIWLVDSWEDRDSRTPGVFRLPQGFSFRRPTELATDGSTTTQVPCNTMFLGYYRGQRSRKPYPAATFGSSADPALLRPRA